MTAKPSRSYTSGSTRGSSDATGAATAASSWATPTSKAATSCPTTEVRANVSHGRRRRASAFEFWMTTGSSTRRPADSASDHAAAVARATSPASTNRILARARSSAVTARIAADACVGSGRRLLPGEAHPMWVVFCPATIRQVSPLRIQMYVGRPSDRGSRGSPVTSVYSWSTPVSARSGVMNRMWSTS